LGNAGAQAPSAVSVFVFGIFSLPVSHSFRAIIVEDGTSIVMPAGRHRHDILRRYRAGCANDNEEICEK
jgi:hypothetical protein